MIIDFGVSEWVGGGACIRANTHSIRSQSHPSYQVPYACHYVTPSGSLRLMLHVKTWTMAFWKWLLMIQGGAFWCKEALRAILHDLNKTQVRKDDMRNRSGQRLLVFSAVVQSEASSQTFSNSVFLDVNPAAEHKLRTLKSHSPKHFFLLMLT